MKQEFLRLIETNEQKLNALLRKIYEQSSDPDLRKKIAQELKELQIFNQNALNRFSQFAQELKKKFLLDFEENLPIEFWQKKLREQKQFFQKLKKEISQNWQEPLEVKILGIGEITTTIELKGEGAPRRKKPGEKNWITLAIKKAPSFPDRASAEKYIQLCYEYENFLSQSLKIQTPYAEHRLLPAKNRRWLVYNFQERLSSESIACLIIQVCPSEISEKILLRLLNAMKKIFLWNHNHPEYQMGFDGQIPNWAFPSFNPEHPCIELDSPVLYLDTTTPLLRKEGKEQLNTEIFLKSIPVFLRPIIRRTLLQEVLDRYYRPRDVLLDLLASFITHHKPELVPRMVELCNQWLEENLKELALKPFSQEEIFSYNRKDVIIWKFFRQMKRLDRWVTEKIFKKTYEQRLPRGSPKNWENLVGAGGKGLTLPESLQKLIKK